MAVKLMGSCGDCKRVCADLAVLGQTWLCEACFAGRTARQMARIDPFSQALVSVPVANAACVITWLSGFLVGVLTALILGCATWPK